MIVVILLFMLVLLLYSICYTVCLCQRKITNGRYTPSGKKYMVYLLNSKLSHKQPHAWLCGGAIVTNTHILTAAACLTEVSHIYAIAGLRKYVKIDDINSNDCTRLRKQKIVRIIIPKDFDASNWMMYDIGFGVVEKPYNFSDWSYRVDCSYEPAPILINFDVKYETAHRAATAYGWGGEKAREPGIHEDINSLYLKEARTLLANVSFCREQFQNVSDYYFLCSYGSLLDYPEDGIDGRKQYSKDNCLNDELTAYNECDDGTKHMAYKNNADDRRNNGHRTSGICQNDHGGPLVIWAEEVEMVIGVALNSAYNSNYQCEGPSVYTSTAQTSVLLKCLLSQSIETRDVCESMQHGVKEYDIEWPKEHEIKHTTSSLDLLHLIENIHKEDV